MSGSNLAVTPGSGAKLATDTATWNAESAHFTLGKMIVGADGVVETISRGQQTMANSLPVALASNQSAVPVTVQPLTTDGLTLYRLLSAATTNAQSVKASAGSIGFLHVTNLHASAVAFLKFYNKASSPTVGTDTPVLTLPIPPSLGGFNVSMLPGLKFGTGIALAITGAVGDADATAITANAVVVNLGYL